MKIDERKGMRISLIILSWNGKLLLEANLPSVVTAVRACKLETEIIVVDNGSADGTQEFIKRHYPEVRLISLNSNKRFTGGNNAGANAAKGDLLVFLNNDVEVTAGFLGIQYGSSHSLRKRGCLYVR